MNPTLYIDIRSPEEYSKGHLIRSLNVPYSPAFCNWALSVLERNDLPITIIHDDPELVPIIIRLLNSIGYTQIADPIHWPHHQHSISENPQVSVDEVKQQLDSLTIIDVRTLPEWNQFHINSALHIELSNIKQALDKIPSNKPIRIICGSGNRSSVAVSFLKAAGFADVRNISGGMRAWSVKS